MYKFEGPYLMRVFLLCHPMVKGREAIEQLQECKKGAKLTFYNKPTPYLCTVAHFLVPAVKEAEIRILWFKTPRQRFITSISTSGRV
jgi:hypothetical protein